MLRSAKRFLREKLLNAPYGFLDAPKPQGLRPGSLNLFSGWVFDQKSRTINGIEVFQGGKRIGICDYGHRREDVYRAHPDFPQARTSGFSGWVSLEQANQKPLYVYVLYENGRRYCLGRRQLPWQKRMAFFLKRNKGHAERPAAPEQKHSRQREIPCKILIAGREKTGTTGLFFKIGNSLASLGKTASETKFLFEPTSYCGAEQERVVAKIIVQEKTSRPVNFEDFKNFNKKILLLRDPRDQLISSLLYSAQNRDFYSIRENIAEFLNLLEKKEHNPRSVSVLDLSRALLHGSGRDLETWKGALAGDLSYFLDFQRSQPDFFLYTYEDFVQNKIAALEDFLGFPLSAAATVGTALSRVIRTKKSGDWQNWFLEEDVSFFKPLFQEFMHALGYEDAWSLPDHQVIVPANASEYVRKNLPGR